MLDAYINLRYCNFASLTYLKKHYNITEATKKSLISKGTYNKEDIKLIPIDNRYKVCYQIKNHVKKYKLKNYHGDSLINTFVDQIH